MGLSVEEKGLEHEGFNLIDGSSLSLLYLMHIPV